MQALAKALRSNLARLCQCDGGACGVATTAVAFASWPPTTSTPGLLSLTALVDHGPGAQAKRAAASLAQRCASCATDQAASQLLPGLVTAQIQGGRVVGVALKLLATPKAEDMSEDTLERHVAQMRAREEGTWENEPGSFNADDFLDGFVHFMCQDMDSSMHGGQPRGDSSVENADGSWQSQRSGTALNVSA